MTTKPAVPADSYSPVEAILLAIADHRAGPITDWPFVDALRKAEERANACPKLVAALQKLAESSETFAGSEPDMPSHRETEKEFDATLEMAQVLLRELGKLE